jgi:hypothetical protein
MSNGACPPVRPEEVIALTQQLRDAVACYHAGSEAGLDEGEMAELYFSAQRAEEALQDLLAARDYALVRPTTDMALPRPAQDAIDRLFDAVAGRDPRLYPTPCLCPDRAYVLRFFDQAIADLTGVQRTDLPAPSGDDEDLSILRVLVKNSGLRLTLDQIASQTKGPRVSRRTVAARMPRLLEDGLVLRPRGKNQGHTIGPRGMELLEKVKAAS